MFTSGYVNTETILHFFYKITNERGTKTVFTYTHVKWFYGQSERAYYLNYFIMLIYKWERNLVNINFVSIFMHPSNMLDVNWRGLVLLVGLSRYHFAFFLNLWNQWLLPLKFCSFFCIIACFNFRFHSFILCQSLETLLPAVLCSLNLATKRLKASGYLSLC